MQAYVAELLRVHQERTAPVRVAQRAPPRWWAPRSSTAYRSALTRKGSSPGRCRTAVGGHRRGPVLFCGRRGGRPWSSLLGCRVGPQGGGWPRGWRAHDPGAAGGSCSPGHMRRISPTGGCWRRFVGCSTCSYDPLRSIDAAEPHVEVVLRAAEVLDGAAEVLGELAFLGNRQLPAGGIQLLTCGPRRAASSISPLHPSLWHLPCSLAASHLAVITAKRSPRRPPSTSAGSPRTGRSLSISSRRLCATCWSRSGFLVLKRVSRAPRYQPATRPSCSASA